MNKKDARELANDWAARTQRQLGKTTVPLVIRTLTEYVPESPDAAATKDGIIVATDTGVYRVTDDGISVNGENVGDEESNAICTFLPATPGASPCWVHVGYEPDFGLHQYVCDWHFTVAGRSIDLRTRREIETDPGTGEEALPRRIAGLAGWEFYSADSDAKVRAA